MYKKLSKAYKFNSDIFFGLFLGLVILLYLAVSKYIGYIRSDAEEPLIFEIAIISSIYFAIVEVILIKAKKKILISNGFTRKTIFYSDLLSILTAIPFLAVLNITTELIYRNHDKYISALELVFKKYVSQNSLSSIESILLFTIWTIGNFILISGIVYLISEINFRLSKKGKIIFFILLGVGSITFIIITFVLSHYYGDFLGKIFGFGVNPIHSTISKLILSLFFFIPSYALVRRCPITK